MAPFVPDTVQAPDGWVCDATVTLTGGPDEAVAVTVRVPPTTPRAGWAKLILWVGPATTRAASASTRPVTCAVVVAAWPAASLASNGDKQTRAKVAAEVTGEECTGTSPGRLQLLSCSTGCPVAAAMRSKSLSTCKTVNPASSAVAATIRSGMDAARCCP